MFLLAINKRRWDRPNAGWLQPGQIHADPLADLRTQDNKLSVWTVLQDESNLRRIVAALAATRENLGKLDCALVDEQALTASGFTVVLSDGTTPDSEANKQWHNDIIQLSGNRLVELAFLMLQHMTRQRYEEEEVVELIALGIADQRIPRSRLKQRVREKFPIGG